MFLKKNFLYQFALRYPRYVIIGSLVVLCLSLYLNTRLKLEGNLTALLPKDFESVQAFAELQKNFGGLGYLVLAVEGKDATNTAKFADLLVPKIAKLPNVLYVDYQQPVDFFKQRQFLYFDLSDLQEIERRIDRSLSLQKMGVSPVFNFLMDFADDEERPDVTFKDIRKKYEDKVGVKHEGRTSTDEGKFIAFRIKTKSHQQDIDSSYNLIDGIKQIEADVKAELGFQNVRVIYSGDHVQAMKTVDYIQKRMALVSGIVFILLFLILFGYFRSLRLSLLIAYPLILGILLTGATWYLMMGHLNILTGFAAGILAGIGSDYGIYLLKRYQQAREAGDDFYLACERAFNHTGRATFASMLTTVVAFLVLCFSHFRAAAEMGMIGALGLFLNYLTMMLVLPAILSYWKDNALFQTKLVVNTEIKWNLWARGLKYLLNVPMASIIIILVLAASIYSLTIIPQNKEIIFEDGRMDAIPVDGGGDNFYGKVASLYGGNLQPTVLLVEGLEQVSKITKDLEKRMQAEGEHPMLQRVLGLSHFIPEEQARKKQILQRLITKYQQSNYPPATKKQELLTALQDSEQAEIVTENNLPLEVTRLFKSPVVNQYTIYVIPSLTHLNWEWMRNYAHYMWNFRKEIGVDFKPADNPFMASEFVLMMEREAPKLGYMVSAALLLICVFFVKPLWAGILSFLHVMLGLILTLGLMFYLQKHLNTINIMAFPIILGTGIDCFIHFILRYEETHDLLLTIHEKLPSVVVSNLTTTVGFAGLLFTPSFGLRSLGWVTVVGIVLMTLLCSTLLLSILYYKNRLRK